MAIWYSKQSHYNPRKVKVIREEARRRLYHADFVSISWNSVELKYLTVGLPVTTWFYVRTLRSQRTQWYLVVRRKGVEGGSQFRINCDCVVRLFIWLALLRSKSGRRYQYSTDVL